MMRKLIPLLFASIVMAACQSAGGAFAPISEATAIPPSATATVNPTSAPTATPTPSPTPTITPTATPTLHPLTIAYLRAQDFPGSEIHIEEELEDGIGYKRYYVSYESEGLTIYALLTVPVGARPDTGWPVIVFNHGYIPPDVYKTTERYIAYVDAFARQGFIVLRPDYRGHDRSEGIAGGAYGSPGYTIDVLNAVASIKMYPDADPNRIGMWGHSMGGYITLRAMLVDPDIKAGVIWAGVVGSYEDMVFQWFNRNRSRFVDQFGSPEDNPEFWESISANFFLDELKGPLQLHAGTADADVPYFFSTKLAQQVRDAGGTAELFIYQEDDHNLSKNFSAAMLHSIRFFFKYVRDLEPPP